MRVMGLLGLVLALVIVGLLVKKQMAATRAPLPSLAPSASAPATEDPSPALPWAFTASLICAPCSWRAATSGTLKMPIRAKVAKRTRRAKAAYRKTPATAIATAVGLTSRPANSIQ